jgi:hypothetical protein
MTKIKNPEKKITFNHKNINHFCKSKDSARSKKIVKDNTKMNNVKEEGREREREREIPWVAGGLAVRFWEVWSAAGRRLFAGWAAVELKEDRKNV